MYKNKVVIEIYFRNKEITIIIIIIICNIYLKKITF